MMLIFQRICSMDLLSNNQDLIWINRDIHVTYIYIYKDTMGIHGDFSGIYLGGIVGV